MRQISSSNYDSLPKNGIFKKENQQIMVLHELDMSGQCDISNLSPEKENVNEDESLMSLGAGEIDTHEKQQMGSHAFVKMINKKAMHFWMFV